MKPLTEMSPEELRIEINLLRENRLVARQQSIEDNKPKPRKLKQPTKPKSEEVDSEIGALMDNIMNVNEESLDIMLRNLGEL